MITEETIDTLLAAAKAVGYGEIPPCQHNECFTTGGFDLILLNCTDRGRNFALLEAICGRYADVKTDPKYLSGYLYLLSQLVPSTDTAEIPAGMKEILERNPDSTTDLRDWYRMKV